MLAAERRDGGRSTGDAVAAIAVAVLGAVVGLFGSIAGPYYPMAFGALLALIGVIPAVPGRAWARLILILGVTILLGATLYVLIGILTPEGSGSGSSDGSASLALLVRA